MSEIGKCPWCACQAEPDSNAARFWVACTECGATGPDSRRSDADAIAAWNRVAQPDPMTVTGRLRWNGNYLYLGPHSLGVVTRYGKVWDAYPHSGNITRNHPTKAAARDALVQAVKEGIGS